MLTLRTDHTYCRIYDSVEDLLATVQSVPEERVARLKVNRPEFIGRLFRRWSQVFVAARKPWQEGIETLEKMLADLDDAALPQPQSRRRRVRYREDDGDELDFDRLRGGQGFWRTCRRESSRGPSTITILVDVCAASAVAHKDILWRGAAAIALAKRLEEAGYRVELWAFCKERGLYPGASLAGLDAVCLKRTGEPLDPSTLIAGVSGWFFRTVFFRAMHNATWTPAAGLGSPDAPSAEDLDQITHDARRVVIAGAFSHSAAVRLVREKLAELQAN